MGRFYGIWIRSQKNCYQKISTSEVCCCCYSVAQSCLTLCNPWTAACQASLSLTISRSLPKFMSFASVVPSSHLILWHPLLLLPSILLSIREILFTCLTITSSYCGTVHFLHHRKFCSQCHSEEFSLCYLINSKHESESEVIQSCPTLCNPMDCSLPGSSVHGIFQATVLEWVAISFSRGFSWPRDRTWVSHIVGRRFTVWATREA